MWTNRPLPSVLLQYAAHDIEVIARLYKRFLKASRNSFFANLPALKAASMRYMSVYTTREMHALHEPQDLLRFMPLDVLDAPDPSAPRYRCGRCERELSISCFKTEIAGGLKTRMSLCRLCVLLARRRKEASLGEWISFG